MSGPKPGSAEWLTYFTASRIAAVVGTSPYESRFSLWHRMHGDIGAQEQSAEMTYGHYREADISTWFADQHPEWVVIGGTWFVSPDIPWAAASLDRQVVTGDIAPLELKTARFAWEWDAGVPRGYQDQVQWQMFVTGAPFAFVAADVAMEYREYRVERDQDRINYLVTEAVTFMDSLAKHQAPPIDGSTHTYMAIRELHPEIDDESVEIDPDLAARWLNSKTGLDISTAEEQQHRSQILAAMGTARRATWRGDTLITRQARNGGTPYAVAARNLPSTQEPAA